MRKFFLFTFFLCFKFVYSQDHDSNFGIIPAPNFIKPTRGTFEVTSQTAIVYEEENDLKIARTFHDYLKETYSLDLVVAKNFIKAPSSVIRFAENDYSGDQEGYHLSVDSAQITVRGKGPGLFYGMQSLIQLFHDATSKKISLPCLEIEDAPRYRYRGLHLDVCRHFFPVSFIKQYIDLMATYKLNTFHWHLTDDQGWRIEIKKYPRLTDIGGYRSQTLLGNQNDSYPPIYDCTPYGGYYTQEQIKEVIQYARDRFITVVPEIEMPGHSMAALAAYPALACGDHPGPFKVGEKWGVFDDVYCAGKDSTFIFLEDVLSEVMDLFPGAYIHIGGDECPKSRWHTCKYCQRRMKDNHLRNENELQSYFVHRIEKFVNSKGRQIIGWDEILEGGLAPNATVMSWRGIRGGIAAARQNHDVIMTPGAFVYFDHLQGNSLQEPLSIGGYTPLQRVYSYDPTPSVLSAQQQKKVIGVQANVWTEYINTTEKAQYMILPRLLALAEIAWTDKAKKDYDNFLEERLPKHLGKLDHRGWVYRVPPAIGARDTTYVGKEFTLSLAPSVAGARIYYTLDGSIPRETDNLYSGPVKITIPADEQRVVKTIVVTPSGKRSAVTTTILSSQLPLAPGAQVPTQRGINYYFIPGTFDSAAAVDTCKASERGTVAIINMGKFKSRDRTFGLMYDGYISITEEGVYTFAVSSDDGSQLLIDGNMIVNNEGRHSDFRLTGAVALMKGFHRLTIKYFQAGGSSSLKALMAKNGCNLFEIPANLLYH